MIAPKLVEPPQRAELSQWHTPQWLAQRLADWVPRNARVLEPACGSGNLIHALLRAGHPPELITAVEVDPAWAEYTRNRFAGRVAVICGDFHALELAPKFDVAVQNTPFENNAHLRFVLRSFELAPAVVGIFPITFESTQERDRLLWSSRGTVTRRAWLPKRVIYGNASGGSLETVALRISRRMQPRRVGERREVTEETWLEGEITELAHLAEVP